MFIAVVPAFNEAKTIGSVVRNLFRHVDQVVVVDDGSADDTGRVAREEGAVVLRHEINRGQGAALETGHEYARRMNADYLLHFDADGQFDVTDIAPALAELKKTSADVLFGSRFLRSGQQIPWMKKYLLLPIAYIFQRIFYGSRLRDAHNGFRILNRRALHAIHITHDRMAHATEIAAQVNAAGLWYIEFPVKVMYREYGQGFTGGVKILKDLVLGKFV